MLPVRLAWNSKQWFWPGRGHIMTVHVPGVEGATLVGETAEAAGVTGVVGAWVELSLGAPPDEGVAAADWLRELGGADIFKSHTGLCNMTTRIIQQRKFIVSYIVSSFISPCHKSNSSRFLFFRTTRCSQIICMKAAIQHKQTWGERDTGRGQLRAAETRRGART